MKALGVGIQDICRDFCRRFAALLREGLPPLGFPVLTVHYPPDCHPLL